MNRRSYLRPSLAALALALIVQFRVLRLREVNQLFVVSEIHVSQFRIPVQSQGLPDKGLELPDQEIGQVECSHFFLCMLGKLPVAFEERIAVGTVDHLYPQFTALPAQQAPGATIRIDHEDRMVPIPVLQHCLVPPGPESSRDAGAGRQEGRSVQGDANDSGASTRESPLRAHHRRSTGPCCQRRRPGQQGQAELSGQSSCPNPRNRARPRIEFRCLCSHNVRIPF